jgi:hypothetical protein
VGDLVVRRRRGGGRRGAIPGPAGASRSWGAAVTLLALWVVEPPNFLRATIESIAFGIGIGGAVFGIGMAVARERIRGRLRRLIAEEEAASGAAGPR